MANAESQQPSGAEGLQFNHAEYGSTPPHRSVTCKACNRSVPDQYYELNQQILCTDCARGVDAQFVGGSKVRRFLKAAFFGAAAALGGTIIIYLFREITGLDAALISILAGYMVGSAVRQGSGYRGGRAYQVMAVFLTYAALSLSYAPYVVDKILARDPDLQAVEDTPQKAPLERPNSAKVKARPAAPDKDGGELPESVFTAPEKQLAPDVAKAQVALKADGEVADRPKAKARAAGRIVENKPSSPGMMLFAIGLLIVFTTLMCFVFPILASITNMPQGLIGLAIVFFGLYQAWQLTRKVSLNIRGPFRLGGAADHA